MSRRKHRGPTAIVGISASGLDPGALRALLAGISPESRLALVLLRPPLEHDGEGLMEMLRELSPLPVELAVDGEHLEQGCLRVAPEGSLAWLEEGALRVRPVEGSRETQPPIDTFLCSAARAFGERAMGVLLSGAGAGGTLGLRAISAAGGLTIVQDPASAHPVGMSVGGGADLVLRPSEIGAELEAHVRHLAHAEREQPAEALDAQVRRALPDIAEALEQATQHDFRHYKASTLVPRIRRRMLVHKLHGADDYVELLERDRQECLALFHDLLVGVTASFRRESSQQGRAIPPPMERDVRRSQGKSVKSGIDLQSVVQQRLLEQFAPRAVVVDDKGRILHASGDMGRYLELGAGRYANDIVQLARQGLRTGVRAALAEARRTGEKVVRADLSTPVDGGLQPVQLEVQPLPATAAGEGLLLVVFTEGAPALLRSPGSEDRDTEELVTQLEQELATTRRDLERSVEELETAIEELKSSNEELLSMNEELQSANEELESSKDQIQDGHEGLRRAHDDLENLLRSTDIATIFLGDDLSVRSFTPAAARLYNLMPADVGRPLEHITHRAVRMPPFPAPEEVERASGPIEDELRTRDGGWFVRRVLPYRDRQGLRHGMVVTFLDVAQLRRTEQRLRSAAHAAEIGTWRVELPAGLDTRDANLNRMLGLPAVDSTQPVEDFFSRIHPEDRPVMREAWDDLVENGGSFDLELRILRWDGTRWFRNHGRLILQAGGELRVATGAMMDITARRRAEDELSRVLDVQRLALQAVRLGTWEHDLATDQVIADERCRELFGLAADDVDLRPASLVAHLHPDDLERWQLALHESTVAEEEVEGEYRVQLPAGGARWLLTRSRTTFRPDGAERRPVRSAGIVMDVTERKLAEMRLRDSEERFRLLADAAPVLIWIAGTDRKCTWFNQRWLAFTGRSLEQELGDGWIEGVHPDDRARFLEVYLGAFDRREPFELDFRLRHRSGEHRWLLDRGVPSFTSDGTFTGFIGGCVDVTGRRTAEDRLRDVDQRKDEFLAILGHELRNPLAALANATQLILEGGLQAQEHEWVSSMMSDQVGQLSSLVDDLLDMTRISSGKIALRRRDIELGLVISRAVETARPVLDQREHALEVLSGPEDLQVHVDPTRLEQVVVNLLTNAAKYTPREGQVLLEVKPEADALRIAVTDSGVGLTPDALEQIFEPFAQIRRRGAARGGLGIGLTLVRQLVGLHGGRVEVESPGPNLGSCFTVVLPWPEIEARGGAEATPTKDPRARLSGARVLVVDDNIDASLGLARLLERRGIVALRAASAQEAIEVAQRERPDIVLLDIGLPDRSGYEVAVELRAGEGTREALLIALTGFGDDKSRAKSQEAGFDDHLLKPVDVDALIDLMARRRVR